MKAHQFTPGSDHDDHECVNCEVRIAPSLHQVFELRCPAGDCTGRANPARGCVFVPVAGESRCLYCGRQGGSFPTPEDTPEPLVVV